MSGSKAFCYRVVIVPTSSARWPIIFFLTLGDVDPPMGVVPMGRSTSPRVRENIMGQRALDVGVKITL